MREKIEFDVVVGEDEQTAELIYDPETNCYELDLAGKLIFSGDWDYLNSVFKRAMEIWEWEEEE